MTMGVGWGGPRTWNIYVVIGGAGKASTHLCDDENGSITPMQQQYASLSNG